MQIWNLQVVVKSMYDTTSCCLKSNFGIKCLLGNQRFIHCLSPQTKRDGTTRMTWKFYGICLYLALKIATYMASQLCIGIYAKSNIYAASYEAYKRATIKTTCWRM